ncbi:hypothetical protein [Tenacibaculum piscium]|uniref:hypothetical protein n=1 Tax=Tenacibaculum piscium TaxID=1458515 RepID=UPI001F31AA00|nr:hypothetical protein [Tenacibaculum piscium]
MLSILFDGIGLLSFVIPGVGEFIDVIWAPLSAFLIKRMYKGTKGNVAATLSFIEEALPGLDIIPTFTLTWIYTYIIASNKKIAKITQ